MKKSQDHTQLKRLAALGLVATLLISSLVMLAPPAAAAPVEVSNDRTGDRVVFEQDYTAMYGLPHNVILRSPSSAQVHNVSLAYDYTDPSLIYSGSRDANGMMVIGGLTPAVQTNIIMDIDLSRDNAAARLWMQLADARLTFRLIDGTPDYGMVSLSYTDEPGGTTTEHISDKIYLASSEETSWRFTLRLQHDGVSGITKIYIDEALVLEGLTFSHNHIGLGQPYASFCPSNIFISWTNMAVDVSAQARIYSITQTVPDYQYVTPIGNAKIQPFGLDGPHEWHLIDDGIAYIEAAGGRGTIWADINFVPDIYSDENMTRLTALLDRGWELGIHFSRNSATMTMEETIDMMEREYDEISAIFGRPPTSWCVLSVSGTPDMAAYAWHNLGLVWRNGYNGAGDGINGLTGTGLYDNKWFFHEAASRAGIIVPEYTHRTDEIVAYQYGISYSNFTSWVDNLADNDITIVPWIDYWQTAQNTYHTEISDLMVDDGKSLSFAIDNIGGTSRLFVAAPFAEIVVDGDGNEVPFEVVDDGIIIEVEAGEYQVMSMSAYRQAQVDRAISPLYSVIPVVIVLAVLGGLFTMLGTAFGRLKF